MVLCSSHPWTGPLRALLELLGFSAQLGEPLPRHLVDLFLRTPLRFLFLLALGFGGLSLHLGSVLRFGFLPLALFLLRLLLGRFFLLRFSSRPVRQRVAFGRGQRVG